MMQLWRKYFFVAHGLFAFIFALSLTIFISGNFKNELQHVADLSRIERDTLIRTLEKWYRIKAEPNDIVEYIQQYAASSVFLEVKEDEQLLVNTMEEELRSEQGSNLPIRRSNGIEFLTFYDSFENYQGKTISVFYAKNIHQVYEHHHQRMLQGIVLFSVCNFIVALLLYQMMKKIYRPIENIAHELRTPLTTIQGYSEYLLRAKIDEEENFFVAEQIMGQAIYLKELVEKLLIIGNLKDQPIHMELLSLEECLSDFEKVYPELLIQGPLPKLKGNQVLMKALFSNLLSNAFRESQTVWIKADGGTIQVGNSGAPLSPILLNKLNQGLSLKEKEVSGMGKGVAICHEIMAYHHGKLTYTSDEKGTIASLRFKEENVQW